MILVFNSGSSSLKYKLFDLRDNRPVELASGVVNDIGEKNCKSFTDASKIISNEIVSIASSVDYIGHRIVFGGEGAIDGEKLNDKALKKIIKVSHFAPLHNPSAVETIKYFRKVFDCPHYLFFDNSFYSTLSQSEKIIPFNQNICKKLSISRQGFHGISHQYALNNSNAKNYSKVISIHIGAGSSVTAILEGRAVATSMGLTPLGGLCMLTRPGDIDPGVVTYLVKKIGIKKTEHNLNKCSGLTGIMGIESNFMDILFYAGEMIEDENYIPKSSTVNKDIELKAKLALSVFSSKTKQFIGSYASIMGGVEALVFTGRAGAGSTVLRNRICHNLDYLNLKEVIVVAPDEELAIAQKIANKVANN